MTRFTLLPAAVLIALAGALPAQTVQTAAVGQPSGSASDTSASNPATLPSGVLRPALATLQQALSIARPEKWKASSAINGESASDIASIQRDLDHTLPPLVNSADAGPAAVPQLLPAYRNIEALYDVLVRVTQTSVLAAPAQQSAAFQQATQSLQQARRDFGDLLDSAAQSQDRRLHDIQARLTSLQAVPPPPPAPVCPTPPPAKKTRPRAKPAPRPAAPAPSTSR